MYHVVCKLDREDAARLGVEEFGSDRLEAIFRTKRDAERHIKAIRRNPEAIGYLPWIAEASLWVVDDNGNLV